MRIKTWDTHSGGSGEVYEVDALHLRGIDQMSLIEKGRVIEVGVEPEWKVFLADDLAPDRCTLCIHGEERGE